MEKQKNIYGPLRKIRADEFFKYARVFKKKVAEEEKDLRVRVFEVGESCFLANLNPDGSVSVFTRDGKVVDAPSIIKKIMEEDFKEKSVVARDNTSNYFVNNYDVEKGELCRLLTTMVITGKKSRSIRIDPRDRAEEK